MFLEREELDQSFDLLPMEKRRLRPGQRSPNEIARAREKKHSVRDQFEAVHAGDKVTPALVL